MFTLSSLLILSTVVQSVDFVNSVDDLNPVEEGKKSNQTNKTELV